ncbi:peptide-methionine (S)-S-oxide reductase MsrA [Zwartia vadi]|uniref:peptide-methionine (S)-S-oxide reductase MsrA n=1 Tax=Zwartia vadi TaxID=3058168 RepID=UPI003F491739
MPNTSSTEQSLASAVFGGGCFWCTEAVFKALKGVHAVQSGYCGGQIEHPTYEQVCSKQTGHIEVVKIDFDPSVISFGELLEVFFATHDPTTPGRQGNDVGPQYQSAIFFQNQDQYSIAKQYIAELESGKQFSNPICTEIRPSAIFWPAEQYHADYFSLHPEQGYCQMVIAPKISKFKKQFSSKLNG